MAISCIIVVASDSPDPQRTIDSVKLICHDIHLIEVGGVSQRNTQTSAPPAQGEQIAANIFVHQHTEPVPYVELIREKSKQYATQEWLLFLDPDEELSSEFVTFVQSGIYTQYDSVSSARKNYIFGKWIQHARWWPDRQVRLFRRDSVIWPTALHAQPMLKGKKYELSEKDGTIIHHNYESIDEYMHKAIRYAKAQAKEKPNFTWADTVKMALHEFYSRFYVGQGYRDGAHGLALSFLQMIQVFLIYFYAWEGRGYAQMSEEEAKGDARDYFRSGFRELNHWDKRPGLANTIKSKIAKMMLVTVIAFPIIRIFVSS